MPGLPEVAITGALVADPELRFTASGVPVANFTIAANDRRYDPTTQQWTDGDATFLRCSIWRQPAEHVAESLTKGARVLATGQLRQRTYETPDGEKRTIVELAVTEIGPSLKFATARVNKATRGDGHARTLPVEEDPWATTNGAIDAATTNLAAAGLVTDDKPPF
jgi:single-strand DNA-binding protein